MKPYADQHEGFIYALVAAGNHLNRGIALFIPNGQPTFIDVNRVRATIFESDDCLPSYGNLKLLTLQLNEYRERTVALVTDGNAHMVVT